MLIANVGVASVKARLIQVLYGLVLSLALIGIAHAKDDAVASATHKAFHLAGFMLGATIDRDARATLDSFKSTQKDGLQVYHKRDLDVHQGLMIETAVTTGLQAQNKPSGYSPRIVAISKKVYSWVGVSPGEQMAQVKQSRAGQPACHAIQSHVEHGLSHATRFVVDKLNAMGLFKNHSVTARPDDEGEQQCVWGPTNADDQCQGACFTATVTRPLGDVDFVRLGLSAVNKPLEAKQRATSAAIKKANLHDQITH